jgi:hypothetical protein
MSEKLLAVAWLTVSLDASTEDDFVVALADGIHAITASPQVEGCRVTVTSRGISENDLK